MSFIGKLRRGTSEELVRQFIAVSTIPNHEPFPASMTEISLSRLKNGFNVEASAGENSLQVTIPDTMDPISIEGSYSNLFLNVVVHKEKEETRYFKIREILGLIQRSLD